MSSKVEDYLKQVRVKLRLDEQPGLYSSTHITQPEDAVLVMADVLKELDREHFMAVNLDAKNRPINFNIVSIGTVNSSPASPAETFKSAILANASAVMLLHNHPSGDLTPSGEDRDTTRFMVQAGAIIGIPVLDHVIVGGRTGQFVSMRAQDPVLFDQNALRTAFTHMADAGREIIAQEVREGQFLYGSEAQMVPYAIYQLEEESPGLFLNMEEVKQEGLSVDGSQYRLVYQGVMPQNTTLDDLFVKFNRDRPEDFTGHSLSVSDVIAYQSGLQKRAFYVDRFGFEELPEFIAQRQAMTQKPQVVPAETHTEDITPARAVPFEADQEELPEYADPVEATMKELSDAKVYAKYLDVMGRFVNYSTGNSLRIFSQNPSASMLATYDGWSRRYGRHVARGEKGLRILVPGHARDGRRIFRPVTVFDVSQTKGKSVVVDKYLCDGSLRDMQQFAMSLWEHFDVPTISMDETLSQEWIANTVECLVGQHLEKEHLATRFMTESVTRVVCGRFGVDVSNHAFEATKNCEALPAGNDRKKFLDDVRSQSLSIVKAMEKAIDAVREELALPIEQQIESIEKMKKLLAAKEAAPKARGLKR